MRLKSFAGAVLSVTAVLIVVASLPAAAHHGWSGYNSEAVTLTGTVKTASYENPHGFVDLDAAGKVWRVVLAPPARMQTRGLARETLKAGITATVVGYQHKTELGEMRAERITIDGKTVELR